VLSSLVREKAVDRLEGCRVGGRDEHLASALDGCDVVVDPGAPGRHDGRAGHGIGVHECRRGEVTRGERRRDRSEVGTDRIDSRRILAVADQSDPAAVRPRLERVGGCVLIDAHADRTARLHRREGLSRIGRTLVTRMSCVQRWVGCGG